MEKVMISALKAIDHPEVCKVFMRGHQEILEKYHMLNITSFNDEWCRNPDVYIVIATDPKTHEVLGGVRIQIANGIHPLPVEVAAAKHDPKVAFFIKSASPMLIGEIGALWRSAHHPMKIVPRVLMRAAMTVISQLHLTLIISFSADYVIPFYQEFGYFVNYHFGNKGCFEYPSPNFEAKIIMVDCPTLKFASYEERRKIFSLRENPEQEVMEASAESQSLVAYNLKINHLKLPNMHKLHTPSFLSQAQRQYTKTQINSLYTLLKSHSNQTKTILGGRKNKRLEMR